MEPRHLAASARCHVEVRLRDDAGVLRVVRDIISGVSAQTVLAFAALATILVAIPGPAVMLVLKSAMLRGRGSAVVTALGVRLLLTSEFTSTGANGSDVSTGNVSRRRALGEGIPQQRSAHAQPAPRQRRHPRLLRRGLLLDRPSH